MKIRHGVAVVLLSLVWLHVFAAKSPKEYIQNTIDNVISILNAPEFKDPAKAGERRKALEAFIETQFDFEDMTRKAVGRDWKGISPEKRHEVVGLFSTLLKKIYLDKFDDYNGEVMQVGNAIDMGKGKSKVETLLHAHDSEIPIYYNVKMENGKLLIYDVNIEGVGLIQNYRSQFQKILADKGVDGLINQLKEM